MVGWGHCRCIVAYWCWCNQIWFKFKMSKNASNDHKHSLTSSLNIHCNHCLHFARCQIWVQNSRKQDLLNRSPSYLSTNCKLCAEHFESSQFTNPSKNRLNWNAVPTLFSVPNPPQKNNQQEDKKQIKTRQKTDAPQTGEFKMFTVYWDSLQAYNIPR